MLIVHSFILLLSAGKTQCADYLKCCVSASCREYLHSILIIAELCVIAPYEKGNSRRDSKLNLPTFVVPALYSFPKEPC